MVSSWRLHATPCPARCAQSTTLYAHAIGVVGFLRMFPGDGGFQESADCGHGYEQKRPRCWIGHADTDQAFTQDMEFRAPAFGVDLKTPGKVHVYLIAVQHVPTARCHCLGPSFHYYLVEIYSASSWHALMRWRAGT